MILRIILFAVRLSFALLPFLLRLAGLVLALITVSLVAVFRGPVRSAEFIAESWIYRLMTWGLPPELLDTFRPFFIAVAYVLIGLGWIFTIGFFVLIFRVVFGL